MKTDLFQFCGRYWVFQICWHIECSTFTASSFRIWKSSTGIPSCTLTLFVVMHLDTINVLGRCLTDTAWITAALGWEAASVVGFLGGTSGKEPACQCRKCKRLGFDPWVWKIPGRSTWEPTPVFVPGGSHGQRTLAVHRVAESDTTEVTYNARMSVLGSSYMNLMVASGEDHLPREKGVVAVWDWPILDFLNHIH